VGSSRPTLESSERTLGQAAYPSARLATGDAVFWHKGEEHEMRSDAGLTALIIEGESLDRFRERPGPAG
jgi:hypothetical protein